MARRTTKAKVSTSAGNLADSMQNLVTGMGTDKDKTFSTFFSLGLMDRTQLDAAYRGDWIARKAVDIPAEDATREWREWQADPDEVEAIETIEKDLRIQQKVKSAMQRGRLYGGGALIMGINQGKPEDEIILDSLDVDCLQFVHVVSRWELSNGPIQWDIESPFYGEPEYYTTSNQKSALVKIHPSRVVRFIGNEIPDLTMANGWGDSVLQAVNDAVVGAGSVSSSIAQLVAEAKLDVIKIPGLSENITNAAYEARLKKRFSFANISKSVYGILLLDAAEEWERINSQFAGLPDVQKMFLLIACGAVDVPSTRFLGQSPAGLSSTGEGDLRNYYDGVTSKQKNEVQPILSRLDEVLIRSALGKMPDDGEGDHGDIHYNWRPLWQMTPAEKAEIAAKKAATFKIDVDAGLINEVVLKKAREAQLIEDGTYPGMEQLIEEFDDDPELENVEPDPLGLAPPITDPNDPNYDPTKDPNAAEFQPQKQLPKPPGQKLLPAPSKKPAKKGAKKGAAGAAVDGMIRRLADASTPRTLYVRRDLLPSSMKAVKSWAKKAGFKSSLVDMHVTIAYSKEPVDWLKAGQDNFGNNENGQLVVRAGGPRVLEKFGKAVVLAFASSDLDWRHRRIKEDTGATWDYDEYTPHVTISYEAGDLDHLRIRPYDGELVFGPEIFEEIKTGFNNEVHTVEDNDAEVVEDGVSPFGDKFNHLQPRGLGEQGGQWVKAAGGETLTPGELEKLQPDWDKVQDREREKNRRAKMQESMAEWMGTGYEDINAELRSGDEGDWTHGPQQRNIRNMERTFDEAGHDLDKDVLVWRGINGKVDIQEGDIVQDRGYQSTTNHFKTAELFVEGDQGEDGALFHITVPKGTRVVSPSVPSSSITGGDPDDDDGFSAEPELLLRRGTRYRVGKSWKSESSAGARVTNFEVRVLP